MIRVWLMAFATLLLLGLLSVVVANDAGWVTMAETDADAWGQLCGWVFLVYSIAWLVLIWDGDQ